MTENHRYNLERWGMLIQQQKDSGMTIKNWCSANGYTKHIYYYWLGQLRKEALPTVLNRMKQSSTSQAFVDITPGQVSLDLHKEERCQSAPYAVIRKKIWKSRSSVQLHRI